VSGAPGVRECAELRDRTRVFRDRADAGRVLADRLRGEGLGDALVLAIPAGGVPVAVALADALGLSVDVAVVSKVTLPWNTEVGCGAVAFDGSLLLNTELIEQVGLDAESLRRAVEATRAKVERRLARLRPGRGPLRPASAVLVDDGLASGFTMRAAVAAVRRAGASRVVVAVPTGSLRTVRALDAEVDALYCANVRSGPSFAVADAYERWSDVDEAEAEALLRRAVGPAASA
jgi:putative phosphoribosyl transferase